MIKDSEYFIQRLPKEQQKKARQAQRERASAPRCPVCGDPKGFSIGTGDCGCGNEYTPAYPDG